MRRYLVKVHGPQLAYLNDEEAELTVKLLALLLRWIIGFGALLGRFYCVEERFLIVWEVVLADN